MQLSSFGCCDSRTPYRVFSIVITSRDETVSKRVEEACVVRLFNVMLGGLYTAVMVSSPTSSFRATLVACICSCLYASRMWCLMCCRIIAMRRAVRMWGVVDNIIWNFYIASISRMCFGYEENVYVIEFQEMRDFVCVFAQPVGIPDCSSQRFSHWFVLRRT
jgi:hypothetical protein